MPSSASTRAGVGQSVLHQSGFGMLVAEKEPSTVIARSTEGKRRQSERAVARRVGFGCFSGPTVTTAAANRASGCKRR